MKIFSRFYIIAIGIIICTEFACAYIGDSVVTKTRNYFGVEFGQYSSSSFFNFSGSQTPTVADSLDNSHDKEYSYNMKNYNIIFDYSRAIINKPNFCLFANFSLPLAINNIERKYLANSDSSAVHDSLNNVVIVYDKTNLPYLNFGMGADYKSSNFIFGLGSNFRISLLGSDLKNIVGSEFVDLSYSSMTPYLSVMYKGAKSFFEFTGEYQSYFDSPISDMLKLRFGVGLTTVESSSFSAFLEYNKSIKEINESRPFSPYQYQYQEDYLKLGIHFDIIIEKVILPGISYELNISGKNTKNMGIFRIYAKYLLNLNK